MNVEDATKVGAAFATVITSLLGYLTWQTQSRKTQAETTEQRVKREQDDERARQERLDGGVWRIITQLESEVKRLSDKSIVTDGTVAGLRETIAALRDENSSVRGDLAKAEYTITVLTGENEKLKARVAELERHDGPSGMG